MLNNKEQDKIWKTLSDPTRRKILDFLRDDNKKTTEIVEHFPNLSRFAVMKHLDVLRSANLVITREDGRKRINSLNAEPIKMIYERWLSRFADLWGERLFDLKEDLEKQPRKISKLKEKKGFGWKKYD